MKAHPQIFEFKPVNKAIYLQTRNSLPLAHIWFRIKDKITADIPLQQQILAFASDYSLLLTATLPHRQKIIDSKMYYASLDHALWFHRDFKIDDWLLYAIESQVPLMLEVFQKVVFLIKKENDCFCNPRRTNA